MDGGTGPRGGLDGWSTIDAEKLKLLYDHMVARDGGDVAGIDAGRLCAALARAGARLG